MTTTYGDLNRPPLKEAELVRALTGAGSRWSEVTVVASAASTNALVLQRAGGDGRSGLVVIAEHQTAGRGRLDRTWIAPPRAAITLSALVRPAGIPVARWPWVSLLSGLAVAAAVRQLADVQAMLKWPNDVVVYGRKLAGVLVERVETAAGAAAVIGIGVNVTTTRAELPTPDATSLILEGASTTDRSTLVKGVLRRLDGLLGEWESAAGEPSPDLRASYQAACSTLGRHVRVELQDRPPVDGTAIGIDDSGRLVLRIESGDRAFGAGDVVHLRPPT